MVFSVFQSTSPVWGMTDEVNLVAQLRIISIHIPRVGDDHSGGRGYISRKKISIHIPRVGDDGNVLSGVWLSCDFNPHPPCGG